MFVLLFAAQVLGLKRYDFELPEHVPLLQDADDVNKDGIAGPRDLARIPQVEILGVRVHALTVPDLHALIERAIPEDMRILLPNVNAHALNLAYDNPWLRDFLNRSTAVFPDGSGALFAARVLGAHFEERVTYADWLWELAGFCAGRGFSLYFLGGRARIAEAAANSLRAAYPDLQVAGSHHGYFDKTPGSPDNQSVVNDINRCSPDILIVGFGMPLQERWLMENWDALHVHVGLTGGAVFDYVSGRLRRPPRLMVDHGLEWLGRLVIEPRRLWRRYLLGIPQFSWRVLRQRWRRGSAPRM